MKSRRGETKMEPIKMEKNKPGDCANCPIACACVYELTGVCLNPKEEEEDKEKTNE